MQPGRLTQAAALSGSGSGFAAETTSLLARMSSQPNGARQTLINNLIVSLKNTSVWAALDVLHVYAAADSQAALLNWKTAAADGTLVNAPSFSADRGFTGNGTTSYINTNFNPVTFSGVQYAQDSCHMGVWSRTDAVNAGIDIGMRTSASTFQSLMQIRISGDNYTLRPNVNASPSSVAGATASSGNIVLRRNAASGATATTVFRNGSSVASQNSTSAAPASLSFFVGAVNTNGTASSFSAREYAAAHLGANLTDQNISDLYSALNTYMTAVGA
jgi:hypothetical protein